MKRYRALVSARRIDFVTFHQTFSYEDFIEGLRPDTAPATRLTAGGFRLKAEDGVFAAIANRAATPVITGTDRLTSEGRSIFKLSLGQSDDPRSDWVYEESLEEGYALFGFRDVDWSDARFSDRNEILRELELRYPNERVTPQMGMVKSPDRFRNQLSIDDIVMVTKGLNAFRAIGLVAGEYEYAPRDDGRYSHRRKVRWLWSNPEGVPVAELSPDKRFSLDTIYELPRTRLNLVELQRLAVLLVLEGQGRPCPNGSGGGGRSSSVGSPAALNQSSRICASSLLGRGETSRTLNVVGRFTALPKMSACCLGSDGSRFITLSEMNGVI